MVPFGVMLEDRVPRTARSQPSPKANLIMAWLQKLLPILTRDLSVEAEEQFSPVSPRQEQVLVLKRHPEPSSGVGSSVGTLALMSTC